MIEDSIFGASIIFGGFAIFVVAIFAALRLVWIALEKASSGQRPGETEEDE